MNIEQRGKALELLRRHPVIDGHADTFLELKGHEEAFFGPLNPDERHIDVGRMAEVGHNVQVQALFTKEQCQDADALQFGLEFAVRFRRALESEANRSLSSPINLILTRRDLDRALEPGNLGFLFFMEGLTPIRDRLENVEAFFRLGLRGMTLTHNHGNAVTDGAGVDNPRGLTQFGREVVRLMEELGITMDFAHCGEPGFWDAIRMAHKPVINSHTGLRAFKDIPRNFSDDMCKAVADTGGVICLAYIPFFSGAGKDDQQPATLDTLVRVFDYLMDLVGPDHVGLGSDWDGFGEPYFEGLRHIGDEPNLIAALMSAGYDEESLAKIMGGNMRRVLTENLPD
jgi:membrane dipeptidase